MLRCPIHTDKCNIQIELINLVQFFKHHYGFHQESNLTSSLFIYVIVLLSKSILQNKLD